MTPDPTTRDPAASLRACIELAAKATPGPWADGAPCWSRVRRDPETQKRPITSANHPVIACAYGSANAALVPAAVNFLRDDAPALLAEVERLRELAATCYAGLVAECDLPEEWADAFLAASEGGPFNAEGLLPYTSGQAADAERYRWLRAHQTDRFVRNNEHEPALLLPFNVDYLDPDATDAAIDAAIHHGARTGESNEG